MKNFSNKGFSLIEILFIVAVLGILSGLAMPRFKTYQALNKRREATTHLTQIFMLMQTKYAEDKSYAKGISNTQAQYLYGRVLNNSNKPAGQCTDSGNWPKIIGFKIDPCDTSQLSRLPTYAYNIVVTQTTFTAQACDITRVVSNCKVSGSLYNGSMDKVTINQSQVIDITCDAIEACSGTGCSANRSTACTGSSTGP